MPEEKPTYERLPKNVVPLHYALFLKPDLKELVFEGRVVINVEVKEPTSSITLNGLDLNITKAAIQEVVGDGEIPAEKIALSNELETLTLSFPETIKTGPKLLIFEFTGEINDKMKGFYRSKYTSPNGDERYAAVTQFESTDARRCFPCWDEPAIKATFDITLEVPADRVALSNMPVAKEETSTRDGFRILHFERTPIMSTYLVAVVVGEYDFIEDTSEDNVKVRVYTPVGKTEQGKFALHCATRVLPYYKDYFQIAYPLPKMDLIAIADFSAGAMENWGLVTYRETCLLVDPENTSAVRKQWIALVVAHEIAHQWFGNLVTMEWWTHLWLNEGYASFVEFLFVDHEFPEYDIWTQFVTDTYCSALELDSLDSSHPIEVPVGHPSEIEEIFDDISYNKGASIIRMLHDHIGDADFRKGMNLYLTRHQYGNTFTEDLWAALGEVSKKPVAAIMSTWTKQKGFPVVRVKILEQQGSQVRLQLQQQRFCAGGTKPDNSSRWMIPIGISTSASREKVVSTILSEKSMETTVNLPSGGWLKINPGTVGFYRTAYPSELLERFVPAVKDKTLPPLDRLGLLDDLFALVQVGEMPTVEVLKLMQAFTAEDNYNVWSTISSCLEKLSILLSYTDLEDDLRRYSIKLLSQIHQRVGWDAKKDESHLDRLLRSLIIGRLANCYEESVIRESKSRFADHFEGKNVIPADLRSAVYRAIMSQGDSSAYDSLLKLYREAELREERDRISRSLGAARDAATLSKVLDFSLSDEVRSQDSVFVIISVAVHSAIGRDLAWNFFKDHWKALLERYESGFLLSRLVKFTTENFMTEEKAQEVDTFFREHKFPATERTVQQSLETIRLNAAWLDRDLPAIRQFLKAQP